MELQMVETLPDKDKEGLEVVYQGIEGAYSQIAALTYFGEKAHYNHVVRFSDAMRTVEERKAEYGVIPIENSSAGAVVDTYDLLFTHNVTIVGEVYIPIHHALLGVKGARLEDIDTVYSHPQGLMQCSKFLQQRNWNQISLLNTAVSANKVKEDGKKNQAAIASSLAAKCYGLDILKEKINNNPENTTRFVVVAHERIYTREAKKISVMFSLPHRAGTLYNILRNFHDNNLNLLKIESRPIPEKKWEYRFFIDIEGNLQDKNVILALRSVAKETEDLRILGNY